jgi:hypothetical protein
MVLALPPLLLGMPSSIATSETDPDAERDLNGAIVPSALPASHDDEAFCLVLPLLRRDVDFVPTLSTHLLRVTTKYFLYKTLL